VHAAASLTAVDAACRRVVGDRLAGLVSVRVRELIDPAAGPPQLAGWPMASEMSELDRAALAFTEQFVIDADGVTDALVAALRYHLTSDEVYIFARMVQQVEARLRASIVLRHEPRLSEVASALRPEALA
jgi:alkylhydroperoxidase family enzyme